MATSERGKEKLYLPINCGEFTLTDLYVSAETMLLRDSISGLDANHFIDATLEDSFRSRTKHIATVVENLRARKWHDVQVRSLPISHYGNILRHYFLRVDELIELHPGTEQRVCLRGWHDYTDCMGDRMDRQYRLCNDCLDRCLRGSWMDTRAFNLALRNCDQSFNGGYQSFVTATLIISSFVSFTFIALGDTRSQVLFGTAHLLAIIIILFVFYLRASFGWQLSSLYEGADPSLRLHPEAITYVFKCSHLMKQDN